MKVLFMKKTAVIIFSLILLASGLVILAGCSIKSQGAVKENKEINNQVATTSEKNIIVPTEKNTEIDNQTATTSCGMGRIVQDKNSVKVSNDGNWDNNWDVLTFKLFDCKYAKDKNKVVYLMNGGGSFGERNISKADLKTFEIIKYAYAKDVKNVYFRGKIIAGADPKTFQILDADFSSDAKSVYWHDKEIKGADVKTFYVFELNYIDAIGDAPPGDISSDKNNIYCNSLVLPEVDSQTFHKLGPFETFGGLSKKEINSMAGAYRDKNHLWDYFCELLK